MTGRHVPGEPRQIRHPGGKDGFWTVDCTAGDYSSGPYAYPGHAEQAAQAHAKAKNDNERGQ